MPKSIIGVVIATNDYELVTESVGLLDRSERSKFVVRGSEAADFLQGQVSNDVEALEPGSGCYATVLTHKGKLRTDLRILRGDDWFWLDTEAIGHAVLEHMLRTYSLGRDVQYVATWGSAAFSTSDSGVLAYQGASPATRQLVWLDRSGKKILRRLRSCEQRASALQQFVHSVDGDRVRGHDCAIACQKITRTGP